MSAYLLLYLNLSRLSALFWMQPRTLFPREKKIVSRILLTALALLIRKIYAQLSPSLKTLLAVSRSSWMRIRLKMWLAVCLEYFHPHVSYKANLALCGCAGRRLLLTILSRSTIKAKCRSLFGQLWPNETPPLSPEDIRRRAYHFNLVGDTLTLVIQQTSITQHAWPQKTSPLTKKSRSCSKRHQSDSTRSWRLTSIPFTWTRNTTRGNSGASWAHTEEIWIGYWHMALKGLRSMG